MVVQPLMHYWLLLVSMTGPSQLAHKCKMLVGAEQDTRFSAGDCRSTRLPQSIEGVLSTASRQAGCCSLHSIGRSWPPKTLQLPSPLPPKLL